MAAHAGRDFCGVEPGSFRFQGLSEYLATLRL